MKFLPNKSRPILAFVIIACFFLPAFQGVSPFRFIIMALEESKTHSDIALSDALIIIVPLALVPLTAIGIIVRTYLRLHIRKTVTGLPFILLFFSLGILSFSGNISGNNVSLPSILFHMQPGFYLAAVAAFLLIFTRDRSHKRIRKMKASETFVTDETVAAG